HLDLNRMRFEKKIWSNEELWRVEPRDKSFKAVGDGSFGAHHLRTLTNNWLVKNMVTNRTWPVPIIVLKHAGLVDDRGDALPKPVVLVEGHRRFSYWANLVKQGKALNQHPVWLM